MEYLLQHLLINSAKKNPGKCAVLYNDESMTYGELDNVTTKLAAILTKNSVKRGDRVGIYVNKSIPSIISMHGILKAGAAYVPLDPKAPPSRLAYIIKNCGIVCLLTSSQKLAMLQRIFPNENPLKLVLITDDSDSPKKYDRTKIIPWSEIVQSIDEPVAETKSIETDLAYILYTSGSTGVPKGVMISHLNAFTYINWIQDTFKISSGDRLSNHAPLHFDLSILDIFGAFHAGATLVLVPDTISTFPIKLAEWINENRISIWYSVPSALTMMLLHGNFKNYDFSSIRTIIFAGEVFPTKYLRMLMASIPHAEFYNLYGPTETNVITYYKVEKISEDQTNPIPIGKPCANMEVFALNKNKKIVSKINEEGELYARGSCVAQGYWGDVGKTNKYFIVNPIQENFQEIIYRTGDIVSLDADGNYIFKGRRDHMIKSRGYRIELGEIETILYSHSAIKEAAVVAIPDDLIGNRIKTYVVTNNNKKLSSSELKKYCGKKLTKYMIPEGIEFRKFLPKTSTGKINRPALISGEK